MLYLLKIKAMRNWKGLIETSLLLIWSQEKKLQKKAESNYFIIQECFRSKEQALISASEAAEMIMRVDDIITCAPRPREKPRMH